MVGKQLCFVQFHTSFHNQEKIVFSRQEIDGAYNAKLSRFPIDFSLELDTKDLARLDESRKKLRSVLEMDSVLKRNRMSLRSSSSEPEQGSPIVRAFSSSMLDISNEMVVQDVQCNSSISGLLVILNPGTMKTSLLLTLGTQINCELTGKKIYSNLLPGSRVHDGSTFR